MNMKYRSSGLFIVVGLLFGGTFVAVKSGLEYLPPLLFLALRFDIAAALLLPYIYFRSRFWYPRTQKDLLGILIAGTISIGLANALLFVGQQFVTSGVAAIIYSLAPVLTSVFATRFLPDEQLSFRGFVGILVGLCGVFLVVRPDPTELFAGNFVGRVILLLAATCVALGSVLIRRVDASVPSLTLVAWALPLSAFLLHIVSLVAGESLGAAEWTSTAIVAVVYVSIFAAAVAYSAYFELLDTVGAIKTNLTNYLVSIVATLGGWLLLGETVTITTIFGFCTIFLGFVILQYSAVKEIVKQ